MATYDPRYPFSAPTPSLFAPPAAAAAFPPFGARTPAFGVPPPSFGASSFGSMATPTNNPFVFATSHAASWAPVSALQTGGGSEKETGRVSKRRAATETPPAAAPPNARREGAATAATKEKKKEEDEDDVEEDEGGGDLAAQLEFMQLEHAARVEAMAQEHADEIDRLQRITLSLLSPAQAAARAAAAAEKLCRVGEARPVRARPGWLIALSDSHSKSGLYKASV